jgi:competence protein ComGF
VWLHDSEKHLLQTDEIEFELFSQELATYLVSVQSIELQSNGSGIRILQIDEEYDIEFTGTVIRKQKNRLGHEPMLLHMTKSQFEVDGSKLKLNVEFESGLQKERVYEISFVP